MRESSCCREAADPGESCCTPLGNMEEMLKALKYKAFAVLHRNGNRQKITDNPVKNGEIMRKRYEKLQPGL